MTTDVGGNPALVNDSDTVNVKPIVEATLLSDSGGSVPSQIQVQLTWNNGAPQSWVNFSTSGHSAGDTYLLAVQGKIVDSWSEPRLTRGGIGFFSPRGEESRLRWVQVTHQYDMLGRICAYLAPYNIPTTNGSW